jgi:hypothetical protein
MIQGHDGSLILSYGDYRDNIILELEKWIFNNIKVEYDVTIYDVNDVILIVEKNLIMFFLLIFINGQN